MSAVLGQKFNKRQDLFKGWWKGLSQRIVAHCPMCERSHVVSIYWVGRGKPRLYCNDCKLMMARRDSDSGVDVYRDCYKQTV